MMDDELRDAWARLPETRGFYEDLMARFRPEQAMRSFGNLEDAFKLQGQLLIIDWIGAYLGNKT